MNRLFAFPLLLLMLVMNPSWAAMFKCIDASGRVSYQEKACPEDAGSASQVRLKAEKTQAWFPRTPENAEYFRTFNTYEILKVVVSTCQSRNAPYSGIIAQSLERYWEVAKEDIEKGREIVETGFDGVPPSEIQENMRKVKYEKKERLRKKTDKQLGRICSSDAAKLQRLASGYKKEDLDSRGNN